MPCREDDLPAQGIRDALFEEFNGVGPFSVVRGLADRPTADDVLDVPVGGASFSTVRVAVRALEDAAGAFLPSSHPSSSLLPRRG